MIRTALIIVLAIVGTILVSRIVDIRHAYSLVQQRYAEAQAADRDLVLSRVPTILSPVDKLRDLGNGKVPGEFDAALADASYDIKMAPSFSPEERIPFGHYDRDRTRLFKSISDYTRIAFSTPAVLKDENARPLQSQIEGTETIANDAHGQYNAALQDYRVLINDRLNHSLRYVSFVPDPDRLKSFEVFNEAGPKDGQEAEDND